MRYIVKIMALALLPPLVLGGHAQTVENEPKVITLSCDGALTATYDANKPKNMEESQKISVVVNLDDQTVFLLLPRRSHLRCRSGQHQLRRKANRRLWFQHQGPY
jgi:hypothetical protein